MLRNRINILEKSNGHGKIIFVIDDLSHEQVLKSSNLDLKELTCVGNDFPLPPGAISVHIDEQEAGI